MSDFSMEAQTVDIGPREENTPPVCGDGDGNGNGYNDASDDRGGVNADGDTEPANTTASDKGENEEEDFKLCYNCEQLDLCKDRFIITKTPGGDDLKLSWVDISKNINGFNPSPLASDSAKKAFATLDHVQSHSDICRLCNLLSQAVKRYSHDRVLSSTQLFVAWEVDGRKLKPVDRIVNRTRRIRLSWLENDGEEENVYLVFVAPPDGETNGSEHTTDVTRNIHFLGRGLVHPEEALDLMKGWTNSCIKSHGNNCQIKHGTRAEFMKLIEGTFFGVIDVVDMQLKALPTIDGEPERYVALSYMWGESFRGQTPYTTTRSNVILHIQKDGLRAALDKFPETIRDAMLLVRQLGERYLWVDSLCIVQDSVSSWELNAKAMHLVYGFAHFTICAADGDATTGLTAVKPILAPERTRNSTSHLSTLFAETSEEVVGTLQPTRDAVSAPLTAECLPGIKLLVSKPPEAVIQDSPWNKRGWTFQERLLSRRCLIFAEGQVYFQCRSAVMSQDIFNDEDSSGWSLDWTNSPLRTLGELRRKAFWFYMKCILLYTGRDLTHPKDILTAFQGTNWLLQQHLNAPLFYGLPASHFDLALLWMPQKVLVRRKPKETKGNQRKPKETHCGKCSHDEFGNCTCDIPDGSYGRAEFPSWSWCGWIGGKAGYQLDMIDGCLIHVQEWLRDHTWILWYVRDYEGNLRPLWDRNVLGEDLSEESRWRGYSGKTLNPLRSTEAQRAPSEMTTEYPATQYPLPPPSDSVNVPKSFPEAHSSQNTGTKSGVRPLWARFQLNNDHHDPARTTGNNSRHPPTDRPVLPPLQPPRARPPVLIRRENTSARVTFGPTRPSYPENEWSKKSNLAYMRPLSMRKPTLRVGARRPTLSDLDEDREDDEEYKAGGESVQDDTSSYTREEMSADGSDDWREVEFDIKSSENVSQSSAVYMRGPPRYPASSRSARLRFMGGEDPYGRPARRNGGEGTDFTGILPDNPFGIIRGPYPGDSKEPLRAMPILQFWTWRMDLYVTVREQPGASGPGEGLCHCNIVDKAGDWCGSIVLSRDWIADKEGKSQVFIAISDAKSFTADECPVWNYYIPKEKDESEWDLYHVLLLERHRDRRVFERVGLGKVFQAAFGEAMWYETKMA